ncbi:MAG: bifunctional (p)ppGpp synthetase/guanosine-3',5'-bis(diphosphate) 3'-pyrophosphohydrolase [Pseudomonadota bacterium]
MVKVRTVPQIDGDGAVDLDRWLENITDSNPDFDQARLRQACELIEQVEQRSLRTSGPWAGSLSSFRTGLDMADILSELRIDEDGLVAAIVYRAVRENQITIGHVRNQYGVVVADLVTGVLKMAAISDVRTGTTEVLGTRLDQLEQARRMLITLVDDVRVALIKLAERTCRIRAVSTDTQVRQHKLATEVFDIYVPLAHRLGVGQLKWELEDLSFRYLHADQYKQIARLLSERRVDRERYVERFRDTLARRLAMIGVEAEIAGRVKHIYSIWRKMQHKGIGFSQVYDVRAVRVLVDDVDECYRVLGSVHRLWANLPGEFDDYIASPKPNGYRSLHTAVIGPDGKVVEVQIRTRDMHEEAELGVCSHWRYKGAVTEEPVEYEERMQWLRQVLEWQEEGSNVSELGKELFSEVSLDRIYVYTPDGHVIDMNPGSTPVDFAYRVHTEIGHRCQGARINGRIVSLNTKLQSGDQIEIIAGTEENPRREWLHLHLGYITSSKARGKVRAWYGKRAKQKNIEDGKRLLLEELSQLGLKNLDLSSILQHTSYDEMDDVFAAIGRGDLDVLELTEHVASDLLTEQDYQLTLMLEESHDEHLDGDGALIAGIGDLSYHISECCGPVPGDEIVGIVSDDETVVAIHRADCLKGLTGDVRGRSVRVHWRDQVSRVFPVNIEINAFDRPGLLYDITGIFMQESTNVIQMQSMTEKTSNRVDLHMTIEVRSLNNLLRNLERIEQLPNVRTAKRTISGS